MGARLALARPPARYRALSFVEWGGAAKVVGSFKSNKKATLGPEREGRSLANWRYQVGAEAGGDSANRQQALIPEITTLRHINFAGPRPPHIQQPLCMDRDDAVGIQKFKR